MAHYILFRLLFGMSSGYALWKGGAPERVTAATYIVAVILSTIAMRPIANRFGGIEWGVLLVDAVTLLVVLGVALRSARYWPLWMTALQLLQVAAHATPLLPGTIRLVYGIAMGFLGYPIAVVLALGTARHQIRVARYGPEPSWQKSSKR